MSVCCPKVMAEKRPTTLVALSELDGWSEQRLQVGARGLSSSRQTPRLENTEPVLDLFHRLFLLPNSLPCGVRAELRCGVRGGDQGGVRGAGPAHRPAARRYYVLASSS